MLIEIREASAEDAEAIATVHVTTWQAAYEGIVPAQFLNELSVTARAEGWRKALETGRIRVLLAIVGNAIAGWLSFGGCRDADKDSQWAEVEAFYVHPALWGKGVGRRLSDAVRALLLEAGYTNVALWVLSENQRAIAFYQRIGFAHDGSSKSINIGGVLLTELRYHRAWADGQLMTRKDSIDWRV
jgi:ribosomal protein S18 acetylase RimI-like enzyme